MSYLSLSEASLRSSVKILAISSYLILAIDTIQSFVFIPLYVKYIGERLYGLWLGTGGFISILSFLEVGIASLIIQRISQEYSKKDFDRLGRNFFSGVAISFSLLLLLFIVGWVCSNFLYLVLKQVSDHELVLLKYGFRLGLAGLVLTLMNNTIEGVLVAMHKALVTKVFQMVGSVTSLFVILFLLYSENPVLAIPIGVLVKGVLSLFPNITFLILLFNRNQIRLFAVDYSFFGEYFRLTPSLLLGKIGTSLVGNIEPSLINMYVTPELSVYYSITSKFASLIRTILDKVGGIFFPSLSHLYVDKEKYKSAFIQLANIVLPASFLLYSCVSLLNEYFVGLWAGPRNFLGAKMTWFICYGFLLGFISNFFSYLLGTTGDVRFSGKAVFFESFIKLILLVIFLRFFGVVGLPIATSLVGFAFVILYTWRWFFHLQVSNIEIRSLLLKNTACMAVFICTSLIGLYLLKAVEINSYYQLTIAGIIIFVSHYLLLVSFNATHRELFFAVLKKIFIFPWVEQAEK